MASDWTAIKELIENTGKAFEEYKNVNDQRIKAVADGNTSKASELELKLTKIDSDIVTWAKERKKLETDIDNQRERIEELETKAKQPGKTVQQKLEAQHTETFWKAMRTGFSDQQTLMELKTIENQLKIEKKDVTLTNAAGGFAAPVELSREIEKQEKLYSPVLTDCRLVITGTGTYQEIVDITGTTDGWVAETGTRSATATASLRQIVPTWGEQYAYPQASEWSLDDIFFNVQEWLSDAVADSFAISLATAVVSGNGSTRPTGITNTAPANVDDFASPLRAAAAIQFVPSAASPDAILPDTLFDLVYKLNSRYRGGAIFTFNSSTAAALRKLKDSTNQYLWQPGLQMGEPDRLLGYGTSIWEQMSNVGANTFPVFFGNFKRGYTIAMRYNSIRITRDEVTNPGYVRFYVRRRVGGIVRNNNAIKALKTT